MTCAWPLPAPGATASRRAGMLLRIAASAGQCPGPGPHTPDAPRTQDSRPTGGQDKPLRRALQPLLPCAAAQRISVLTCCQCPSQQSYSNQRVLSLRGQQPGCRDACAAVSQAWKPGGLCTVAAIQTSGGTEPCMGPPQPGAGWQGKGRSESLLCSTLFLLAEEVFQ